MTYSRGGYPHILDLTDRNLWSAPIQSGVPVLDQDVNLMQRILAEKVLDFKQKLFTSGWEVRGNFGGYGENIFTIDDSKALVAGMEIEWKGVNDVNNTITLPGAGATARKDLVFLEVWLEEVGSSDTFYKYGNEDYYNTNLTNDIIDPAVGLAAANRVQIRYRTRVTTGVAVGSLSDTACLVQGAKSSPQAGVYWSYDSTHKFWYSDTADKDISVVDGRVWALEICVVQRPDDDSVGDPVDTITANDVTDLRVPVTEKADQQVNPIVLMQRSKFTWTDGNTLTIGPGGYYYEGALKQNVFWHTDITFDLGSDGSNASSDGLQADLGVSGIHYIYLDDSAIINNKSPELDASCFLNCIVAPVWSDTKHGWYGTGVGAAGTNDKCILGVPTDNTEMYEFFHDGGEYVSYGRTIQDRVVATITTDWSDEVTLTIPGFSQRAEISVGLTYSNGSCSIYWRTNGQLEANGHEIASVSAGSTSSRNTFSVMTDSDQKIEMKSDTSNNNTVGVWVDGYYLPPGM